MLVPEARRTTALPKRWSHFLIGEKCAIVSVLPVADHHVGGARHDRLDEPDHVAAVVLVVGVRVDDHVGLELERRRRARPGTRRPARDCW